MNSIAQVVVKAYQMGFVAGALSIEEGKESVAEAMETVVNLLGELMEGETDYE